MNRPLAVFASCALLVFCALGERMIRVSAPTFDEPVHLASGYTALVQSRRLLNAMDHPPLAEAWAALPLLALRPNTFFARPEWLAGRVYNYADVFLYKNDVDARRLLDTARRWSLATWGAALLLPIVLWSARLAGPAGAAGACLLFAFCPPLLSNAALVTTDAGPAALFAACFFFLSLEPRPRWAWAAAGACAGAALASKFSMIVLPPLAAALALAEARAERRDPPWAQAAVFAAAGFMVLAAAYRLDLALFWRGLSETLERLGEGRGSFLLGRRAVTGQLGYFPAAVLVKTPLPLLIAAALGAWSLLRSRRRALLWLGLPAAAFFAAALTSKTQIGYRHLLPVYPALVVLGGCGLALLWSHARGRVAASALALWLSGGVVAAGPHYLAYFNEVAGGPAGGSRWLVDSNLDWGQGLEPLAAELKKRGNPPVYLSYFGVADPSYYGIKHFPVAWVSTVERREGVVRPDARPPLLAVSATNRRAVYFADGELFSWLEGREPAAVPGHSIFLYELGDEPGVRGLAELLRKAGQPGAAEAVLVEYGRGARGKDPVVETRAQGPRRP